MAQDRPWQSGDVVRIITGPYADFEGIVEAVIAPKAQVRVLITLTDGRATPVTLGINDIAMDA